MTTTTIEGLPVERGGGLAAGLRACARQCRYEQRSFWRNRSRAFFSFLLPLLFLVVFASIFHGERIGDLGGLAYDSYLVPGLLAYGVIVATFANIAVQLAAVRESGVLKRMRGTPLPHAAYVGGVVGSAVVTAIAVCAVTLTVAALAYGVEPRPAAVPGLVAALVAGTACFAALGLAVMPLVRSADTAPAVTNGLVLPLSFVSGVWGYFGGMPAWLADVGRVFPIEHLAAALRPAFDPAASGAGLAGGDLALLALWATAAFLAACRFLRGEVRRG